MIFSAPGWLAVGCAVCLCILWLWHRHDIRQRTALKQFIAPHLHAQLTQSVSAVRRRIQRGLLLAALMLLFVALAGPLMGYRWESMSQRGNEIIFAIDTSRSMLTPDMRPNRLTRAKLAIADFTNKLDGDAVGLVAFAGSAFLACPITFDYGAFHESLNAIDINTIPRGGTNITSAIREAQDALRRRPGSDKILILVTDGEDLEGDALVAARAAARQEGLKIYTVGVGTAQGDLIPLNGTANDGFVKDDSGNFVKSRLDEAALKSIAEATGGIYAPLGTQGQGLDVIFRSSLAPAVKHELASRRQRVYNQCYQWPLAASLVLLLMSVLIGNRRRTSIRSQHSMRAVQKPLNDSAAMAGFALLLMSLVPFNSVRASVMGAEDAYKKGDFVTAEQEYAAAAKHDPKKPILQFNAGTAAYRAGKFSQAAQAFQDSISHAPAGDAQRLADQEDAYYNLGNTLYRSGQKTEKSSPQQTLQTWAQAVKAYDTALQLRANDADSKFNRDLVKQKIEELKKKQDQQQAQQQSQGQEQQPSQKQTASQSQAQPANSQQSQRSPPQQANTGSESSTQSPASKQSQQPGQQQLSSDLTKPGTGTPKPNSGGNSQVAETGQETDAQYRPGQMTVEEARQLLDSQKGEERQARGTPVARTGQDRESDRPAKDW